MNILLQQQIFTIDELVRMQLNSSAPWEFVLEVFGRLKQRAQCVDIYDRDRDGVMDTDDNCYLTFNPLQRDDDNDGIGNVCDDDIDNDTVKNPLGVIDDGGNIDPSRFVWFTWVLDNCLTRPNTKQSDRDSNACDVDENVGIKIETKQITKDRFIFVAVHSWSLTGFTWFYGDGTTAPGIITPHTYNKPWDYTVRVDATTPGGKIISATTDVIVWPQTVRATLLPDVLVQKVWVPYRYVVLLQWLLPRDIDYVTIVRNDGRTRQLRGDDITVFYDTYTAPGTFPIQWIIATYDGRTIPLWTHITVTDWAFCLPQNKNSWKGHCDLDKDTIPDLCDGDIDGDTAPQPLWLVQYEKKDCTFGPDNVNPALLPPITPTQQNPNILPPGTDSTIPSWNNSALYPRDRCPFIPHADQWLCLVWPFLLWTWVVVWGNSTSLWTWIVLSKNPFSSLTWVLGGSSPSWDIDNDGNPNATDTCPLLPETINGIADGDGCPEIDVTIAFPPSQVIAGSCQSCPCQFAKDDASLAPWDRVKAVLFDKETQKQVTTSERYTVP
jgi:PKD domain/Thrombospondin type 3 repeat